MMLEDSFVPASSFANGVSAMAVSQSSRGFANGVSQIAASQTALPASSFRRGQGRKSQSQSRTGALGRVCATES
nr:hypothetical protein Itr_chr08CG12030 [Ipomoea trifida]